MQGSRRDKSTSELEAVGRHNAHTDKAVPDGRWKWRTQPGHAAGRWEGGTGGHHQHRLLGDFSRGWPSVCALCVPQRSELRCGECSSSFANCPPALVYVSFWVERLMVERLRQLFLLQASALSVTVALESSHGSYTYATAVLRMLDPPGAVSEQR